MTDAALWFARHAPAARSGICYGRIDVAVAIDHADAADALARSFPGARPAVVWTSSRVRCRAVAERLAARWNATLAIDDALAELDFGAWEGRAWDDIAASDAFAAWSADWIEVAPPNGERARDLEARVRAWWSRLRRSETHALVGHAGVARALRVTLESASWHDAMTREIPHLAWTRYRFDAAMG